MEFQKNILKYKYLFKRFFEFLFFQVEKFRIPADDDSDSSISFIDEIREKKGL